MDSQIKLSVNLGISEILADVREQDLHFFCLPLEYLRQESEGHSFKSLFERYQIPCSYRFLAWDKLRVGSKKCFSAYQMLVLRPRPDRQAEPLMVDVFEPSILYPPLDFLAWIGILAERKTGTASEGVPLHFGMLRLE